MSMRVLYRILLSIQKIHSQTVLAVFAQYDIFSVSSTCWRFSEKMMQVKQIVANVMTFREIDNGAIFIFVAELTTSTATTVYQKFTLLSNFGGEFNAIALHPEDDSPDGGKITVHDSDEVILLT
jgi:hypothetical protein